MGEIPRSEVVVNGLCTTEQKARPMAIDHNSAQFGLPIISRSFEGNVIQQRARDGYINATAMCRAAGKLFADYARNQGTAAFLNELSADMGIPISELIQSVKGGDPSQQGTWVHPHVATNLAQWLSPKFAVQVSKWIYEWFNGRRPSARLPFHIRRYVDNQMNVPAGHFSVLTEITMMLIAPLEALGVTLPESVWPDISEGLMFARWLRDHHGLDTAAMPTYMHVFEDGRPPVPAKAYPDALLADFREHFREVWLRKQAAKYFATRAPQVATHLPRLLPANNPKQLKLPPQRAS